MKQLVRALVLVMLSACCALITTSTMPSFAAQGDPVWPSPVSLSASYGPTIGIKVHGDGTVSTTTCGGDARFDTFDAGGQLISTTLNQTGGNGGSGLCSQFGAVGVDGTIFYTGSSSGHRVVWTAKNGITLNQQTFSVSCSGTGTQYGQVNGSRIGTDGNFYAEIIFFGACSQPDRLISLDGKTGALRFNQPLPGASVSSSTAQNTIGVYDGGVVLVQDLSDNNADQLLYYDYSGTKNDTLSCALTGLTDPCGFTTPAYGYTGENINGIAVDSDGSVFIDTSRYVGIAVGGSCPTAYRTLHYDTSGTASVLSRPSDCSNASMVRLGAGDVRFYYSNGVITAMNTAGSTLYTGQPAFKTGYTVYKSGSGLGLILSGNGKIVVERVASPVGSSDRFLYVDELQPDGTWTTLFSTEQFATSGTDYFDYRGGGDDSGVAFGNGVMYVAYCVGVCSTTTTGSVVKLQKIDSPGMSIEYPRGEVFDEYFTNHGAPLNYVALGDSFSSGEGNPPFINGTDVTGTNECHRSPLAYPILLDQDPTLNLNLQSFRACSGATTQTLVGGQTWSTGGPSSGSQLDSINGDTDIVTLTIGGNDVNFKELAEACYASICTQGSSAYDATMDAINSTAFHDHLVNLYENIADTAYNAKIYVIGYPQIASDYPYSNCSPFDTTDEAQAVRAVVAALNTEISNAVDEASIGRLDRFRFIDPNADYAWIDEPPFVGHELCTYTPFFKDIDPLHQAYSYHPNIAGQSAYELVAKEAITHLP